MFTFERVSDPGIIREIMTDPQIYPFIKDDFAPEVEDFWPPQDPKIMYVAVRRGEILGGLWVFLIHRPILWEVHTCLLPDAFRLRDKVLAAREMAQWVWQQGECECLITWVPKFNARANAFARMAGMQHCGTVPVSYKWGGKLHDQDVFSLTRNGARVGG